MSAIDLVVHIGSGTGAGCDQKIFGGNPRGAIRTFDFERMNIGESPVTFNRDHLVAMELRLDDIGLPLNHGIHAEGKIRHGDLVAQLVVLTVKRALAETAEVEHGLAQSLARNRSAVYAHSAEFPLLFDNGDFLAQLGGANCALLAGGAASEDYQVIIVSVCRHKRVKRDGKGTAGEVPEGVFVAWHCQGTFTKQVPRHMTPRCLYHRYLMADESSNPEPQTLAEHYRELSDDALSAIAKNAGELTPGAFERLNRELSFRGMPTAQAVFSEEYMDSSRPVLLERFLTLHEALIAKGQLESAGIPSSLVDDNIVRMDWFYSNLIGGVKLVVQPENEPAAREVLAQPIPASFDVEGVGEYEQPVCPKCRSRDISFESLDKPFAYGSMWLGVPIPFGANQWRCHACDNVWEGTEDDSPQAESPHV
jgi:hypothetical protein